MKLTPQVKKELTRLVGPAQVLTDDVSLALYAYDCSLSRTRPDGVVLLQDSQLIAPVVHILRQHKIPFVARASATNHAGSCATLKGGIVLNLTALNHILEINTQLGFAWVEPGVITATLQERLAPLGFFYAPDPASEHACTIGGNMAQNASGARCLKYGGTREHILAADVVLPDGSQVQLSQQDLGPDLLGLLAGSEGTLGIITRLKVRILPVAKNLKTFLITFPSLQQSVQTVSDLIAQGIVPRCVEAMDQLTIRTIESFAHAGYPTQAQALLIVELDGAAAQIKKETTVLERICTKNHATQFTTAHTEQQRLQLWQGRKSAFASMARLAPSVMVGDGTVPRSRLPQALERVQHLLEQNHVQAGLLFHAGDGNFHPHLLFDERNKLQTTQAHKLLREILKICIDEQGTLSGEHGIGVEKRAVMSYAYDAPTLQAMVHIKQAFDPMQLANPLKIIPQHFKEEARPAVPLSQEVQALQSTLLAWQQQKKQFVIAGNNTHLKTKSKALLSARALRKIIDIDLHNYTATVQAGVLLTELETALKRVGAYSVLPAKKGTVGGALCSGMFPDFYAQVLGIEALLPDGSYVRYGGKYVKNAAGYSLSRLFAGSQGTLGLVTQLTFKIQAASPKKLQPKVFTPAPVTTIWERLRALFDPQSLILNNTEKNTHA